LGEGKISLLTSLISHNRRLSTLIICAENSLGNLILGGWEEGGTSLHKHLQEKVTTQVYLSEKLPDFGNWTWDPTLPDLRKNSRKLLFWFGSLVVKVGIKGWVLLASGLSPKSRFLFSLPRTNENKITNWRHRQVIQITADFVDSVKNCYVEERRCNLVFPTELA
jgi:hypothetical protein